MNRDNRQFFLNRAAAEKQTSVWLFAALLLMAFCTLAQNSRPPIKFVDRLMLQQSSTRPASMAVDHIVLHFCSDVIAHPDHPYDIDRQIEIFRQAPASANYLIARDGTVYRLVPEDRVAWHAGTGHLPWDAALKSMNQQAIGIEMFAIGSPADMKLFGMSQAQYDSFKSLHPDWVGFSEAQYTTLKQLIDDIRVRHPAIVHDRFHIIGHEEWAGRARRTDPGQLFDWTRIGLTRERPAPRP
ncbi:MAG: N-acetylmuramoyl-L-alanine amidase [Verrucomicrobiota bacterium]|jgi:N-acetyl-anhydromuramyl-L-alanine amidase AmpD